MNEIAEILQSYPTDCQPQVIEPLGSAGGLSGAKFWRVVAPRGALVLRCWPIEHPTPEGLQFIHAVLRHAASRGMKTLPVPIAATSGGTFLRHAGHLWELAPWLPGIADYNDQPRVEKLRAAMRALAEFHISVADLPRSPGHGSATGSSPPAVTSRLARLHQLQNGGIDSLARVISDDQWPELAPLAREFSAALPRIVPIAIAQLAPLAIVPLPQQACIRDVWHDHVLFDGDTVTGLIDFGAMQIDTPATDVARLLGSLVGDERAGWQEGLASYSAARPLSDGESQAASALDVAGTILAGCNWIRWIYEEDRQFEDAPRIIQRIARILERSKNFDRRG